MTTPQNEARKPFTDVDLKDIEGAAKRLGNLYSLNGEFVLDLLARLRAAEAVCRIYQDADKRGIGWMAVADHRMGQWLRSKGEEKK
jgi:hypothetical protein